MLKRKNESSVSLEVPSVSRGRLPHCWLGLTLLARSLPRPENLQAEGREGMGVGARPRTLGAGNCPGAVLEPGRHSLQEAQGPLGRLCVQFLMASRRGEF